MVSARAGQPEPVRPLTGRVCRKHRDRVFPGRNGPAAGSENHYDRTTGNPADGLFVYVSGGGRRAGQGQGSGAWM
jgi:hypothetical protein